MGRIWGRAEMYSVLVQKPLGKSHLEDPGADWRIILKYNTKKRYGRVGTGLSLD